ncbi:MAG: foldase [Firmicutes bacterium]|nr:foldase [Bacillota bacterium]
MTSETEVLGGEGKRGRKIRLKPQHLMAVLLVIVILGAALAVYFSQRDQVFATVNGEKISKNELFDAMYAQNGEAVLDDLIMRLLIKQEGRRLGLIVTNEEIEKIITENFPGGEEELNSALQYYGLTMDAFREETALNLLLRKIAHSQIEIGEGDTEEYYEANKERFSIPTEVEARHILVETEEEANALIAQLEDGADFAELAKEHSLDTANKDSGGNLGYFTKNDMVAEFSAAAFDLAVGERSQPVKTSYGYHIIEVLNRKEGRERSYDEVKDEVREALLEEKTYEFTSELLVKLRAEAKIKYNVEK